MSAPERIWRNSWENRFGSHPTISHEPVQSAMYQYTEYTRTDLARPPDELVERLRAIYDYDPTRYPVIRDLLTWIDE